jgi:hypothetical protein
MRQRLPARGEQAKRLLLSTPFLGAVIAALSWPFGSVKPATGLDPSWVAGLYMAVERGMDAGTQIIFTYGPLGFLSFPNMFDAWLGRIAFAWFALAQVAYCCALLWGSRRAFGVIGGVIVTAVAATTPVGDPILIAVAVLAAAALLGDWSLRSRLVLATGTGALAGMQLLGSLRAGPTLVVMGAAALFGLPERRRTFPAFLAALVLAFLVFWFATGQGVANLDDYLVHTAEVVGGYSESMVIVEPGRWWQAPASVVGVAVIAVLAAAAVWRQPNRIRVALPLLIAALVFLMLKHASVRSSPGSYGVFLAALLAIGLILVPYVRRPLAIAAVVVLAASAYVGNKEDLEFRLDFPQHASDFVSQLGIVALPGRAGDEQQRGREAMQAAYALTPAELAELRSGTVHIAPNEAGIAWAYELDWDPLPVFQHYAAYTPGLDELNAAKLDGSSAPDMILWQNTTLLEPTTINSPGAIDDRWPAFESPAQMVQMLCRYRTAQWDDAWAILRRSPNRCGSERHLSTVVANNAERVPLPRTRPDEALIVRVKGLSVSGLEKLRALLFRATSRHVLFEDSNWSLVGDTAEDGLLLRVPRWADYPGKFALDSGSPTVGFEREGGFLTGIDSSTRLTLSFYALPLDAFAIAPGRAPLRTAAYSVRSASRPRWLAGRSGPASGGCRRASSSSRMSGGPRGGFPC